VLETSQNLEFPQTIQVRRPITGAGGKILHILMDENACDLVVMIVELSLLLQDIVGRNLNIRIELPNDYFPHFRTRDNCANVILDTGR
jgi:hypothetical protein